MSTNADNGRLAIAGHQGVPSAPSMTTNAFVRAMTDILHLAQEEFGENCILEEVEATYLEESEAEQRRQRQKHVLRELDEVLRDATDCGLFDAIACDHPDTINKFCDLITDEVRNK